MTRPRKTWLAFAVALAVLGGAMAWVSRAALRLEGQRRQEQRLAAREELVRLALWRMDAALTAVVGQENTHPYDHYQPLVTVTGHAARSPSGYVVPPGAGDSVSVRRPSPLLLAGSPLAKLYFKIDDAGEVTSPQVPPEADALARRYVSEPALSVSAGRLEALRAALKPKELLAALPSAPANVPGGDLLAVANLGIPAEQRAARIDEFSARSQFHQATNTLVVGNRAAGGLRSGEPRSVWMGELLLLARRVSVGGRTHVVGCWLDWDRTRRWLLDGVRDLLPSAALEPLPPGGSAEGSRRLAALPVRLVPGPVATPGEAAVSPMVVSLAAAWGGLIVAAAGVAVLLAGALALSERRGAFVSAVTHELRTPLTTLRMYTEMLADGAVADGDKARQYLQTVHAETNRLCRLVENVLTWSQLEGRRRPVHRERVALGELLGRIVPRLEERARQGGMELVVEAPSDGTAVVTDPAALEQILFNLVDNACKYASGAGDKRVHVECRREGGSVALRVRDHGPGLAGDEARGVFRPFFRARRDSAGSAGGVGLGLAIGRRLARSLGGELAVDAGAGEGASFTLTLPQE